MNKKILYVSAFIPDENGGSAGKRAASNNLDILIKNGFQVDVIVCTTEQQSNASGDATVIYQNVFGFVLGIFTYWKYLSISDLLVAHILHARVNRNFVDAISTALNKGDYERIFVDFTQAIKPTLIARSLSGVNTSVSCCLHDIYVQKFLRQPDFFSRLIYGTVIEVESEILQNANQLLLLNTKDEAIINKLYLQMHTSVLDVPPPLWTRNVKRTPLKKGGAKLLCYGNFNRIENSASTLLLIRETLPAILNAFPDCQLQLLGTGSKEFHNKNKLPDYVVPLGFIDDPAQVFSECACVLVPLTMGAGVKFKVLDALAARVPVIGTGIAFEGIERGELTIEASLEDFSGTVIHFLTQLVVARNSGNRHT